jgi:hypothetical protein
MTREEASAGDTLAALDQLPAPVPDDLEQVVDLLVEPRLWPTLVRLRTLSFLSAAQKLGGVETRWIER